MTLQHPEFGWGTVRGASVHGGAKLEIRGEVYDGVSTAGDGLAHLDGHQVPFAYRDPASKRGPVILAGATQVKHHRPSPPVPSTGRSYGLWPMHAATPGRTWFGPGENRMWDPGAALARDVLIIQRPGALVTGLVAYTATLEDTPRAVLAVSFQATDPSDDRYLQNYVVALRVDLEVTVCVAPELPEEPEDQTVYLLPDQPLPEGVLFCRTVGIAYMREGTSFALPEKSFLQFDAVDRLLLLLARPDNQEFAGHLWSLDADSGEQLVESRLGTWPLQPTLAFHGAVKLYQQAFQNQTSDLPDQCVHPPRMESGPTSDCRIRGWSRQSRGAMFEHGWSVDPIQWFALPLGRVRSSTHLKDAAPVWCPTSDPAQSVVYAWLSGDVVDSELPQYLEQVRAHLVAFRLSDGAQIGEYIREMPGPDQIRVDQTQIDYMTTGRQHATPSVHPPGVCPITCESVTMGCCRECVQYDCTADSGPYEVISYVRCLDCTEYHGLLPDGRRNYQIGLDTLGRPVKKHSLYTSRHPGAAFIAALPYTGVELVARDANTDQAPATNGHGLAVDLRGNLYAAFLQTEQILVDRGGDAWRSPDESGAQGYTGHHCYPNAGCTPGHPGGEVFSWVKHVLRADGEVQAFPRTILASHSPPAGGVLPLRWEREITERFDVTFRVNGAALGSSGMMEVPSGLPRARACNVHLFHAANLHVPGRTFDLDLLLVLRGTRDSYRDEPVPVLEIWNAATGEDWEGQKLLMHPEAEHPEDQQESIDRIFVGLPDRLEEDACLDNPPPTPPALCVNVLKAGTRRYNNFVDGWPRLKGSAGGVEVARDGSVWVTLVTAWRDRLDPDSEQLSHTYQRLTRICIGEQARVWISDWGAGDARVPRNINGDWDSAVFLAGQCFYGRNFDRVLATGVRSE